MFLKYDCYWNGLEMPGWPWHWTSWLRSPLMTHLCLTRERLHRVVHHSTLWFWPWLTNRGSYSPGTGPGSDIGYVWTLLWKCWMSASVVNISTLWKWSPFQPFSMPRWQTASFLFQATQAVQQRAVRGLHRRPDQDPFLPGLHYPHLSGTPFIPSTVVKCRCFSRECMHVLSVLSLI